MLSKELIDNDKGFSNLIIHSQKGKNIFEDVKNNLMYIKLKQAKRQHIQEKC